MGGLQFQATMAAPRLAPIDPALLLIDHIEREVIRRPGVSISGDTPLVSSGLIDSFALIQVFMELQKVTNRKIPAAKVRAKDMDTVRLMLALAERMGTPRQ